MDFDFYKDSLKFIGCLSFISILGMAYTVYMLANGGESIKTIILTSLDIVTVTVPPALPTCVSIGISFAMIRLKVK